MKPIIGIITRKSLSENNHNIDIVYKDIATSIIKSGGIPIGIFNEYFDYYLSICDGFILQGGSTLEEKNYHIIKLLHQLNIPLLAICLGMQEMALVFGGKEIDIPNHQNTTHKIHLKDNTVLMNIIKSHHIEVNSRHKSAITNHCCLTISATSSDNIIEVIEDTKKKFFLGLQYHPENIYDESIHSRLIFSYFIEMCQDKK
jgi:GMP synthase (glutamine-hydrolyzing)